MNFKFWDKSHEAYKTDTGMFTVPVTGYYTVSSRMMKYRDTGRKKWVSNDDRFWFEFWKPKMVEVPEYEQYEDKSGCETRYLEKGQQIESDWGVKLS